MRSTRRVHQSGLKLITDAIADLVHPIIFEGITGASIHESALHTDGGAGPSGLDAQAWRRICSSFQKASSDLCEAVASVARRMGSSLVDPTPLMPLTACRLVALDKCPGVRPVGIGEVVRRIIGKAILNLLQDDIRRALGCYQLCVGQRSGCEAAVHALNAIYDDATTEAVLLVDATNAFNSLNRKVAFGNGLRLCPSLATMLVNTYRCDPYLFIDGETIRSREGTTQGDPMAMAMYAIATLPLIQQLEEDPNINQIWYADDSAAGGGLSPLRQWWKKLEEFGPSYGYEANPGKSWLIVKEEHYDEALQAFQDMKIQISTAGRKYLGSAIGTKRFKEAFVTKKVEEWTSELRKLSTIAQSQPHSAYCSLMQSMKSKWTYILRTMSGIEDLLQPVEEVIRRELIPAITGRKYINDEERRLFALPPRLGGMGIDILPKIASRHHRSSSSITKPLRDTIIHKAPGHENDHVELDMEMEDTRRHIKEEKQRILKEEVEEIRNCLNNATRKGMNLAQEKGASVWLTSRPIEEHGYFLHKGAFRDAIALRYGWRPEGMPSTCVCGKANDVSHALSCPRGGYIIQRHNEVRDTTAAILKEAAPLVKCVEIEPALQPLTGETLNGRTANQDDNSRLDVKCKGFWNSSQDAFFDVRIVNPLASSYRNLTLEAVFKANEKEKRRAYEERVRNIEHGSFTPLVLAVTGGMGRSASVFYKRLASTIAEIKQIPYSKVITWIRCKIQFSLLRSAITAIRGSRSTTRATTDADCISVALIERRAVDH